MDREPCVYILASRRNGTLYIGVTADLIARLDQHRSKAAPESFTARYGVTRLVHLETFDDMPSALEREKQLKRWHRPWKLALIERHNPDWRDLALDLGFPPPSATRKAGP